MTNKASQPVLSTIGHSNHDWPTFLSLLLRHQITEVADVRSQPTSRLPQFRKIALERQLPEVGIEYLFLGRELGARRDEPECYFEGRATYERIAELPLFRAGIEQIRQQVQQHHVVLMCAEKEPLDCHRTILICRHLREHPLAIRHILAGGELEAHAETERRLIRRTGISPTLLEPDLTDADRLHRAYEQRGREIAYRLSGPASVHAAAR